MWEIFCLLSKHEGRSPLIVRRHSLQDEGMKQYLSSLCSQITINVLKILDSVRTVGPVNRPGHPPDVTALTVSRATRVKVANQISKETNVKNVLRGFREMVAKNVYLVSKVMNVRNVLRGSKEIVANNVLRGSMEMSVNNVPLVSKEMTANSVLKGSRELIATNVPLVFKATIVNNALIVFKEMDVKPVLLVTMVIRVVSYI